MHRCTSTARSFAHPLLAAVIVLLGSFVTTGAPVEAAGAVPTPIPASADWLSVVNYYRAMAGVAPVTENATYSAGAQAHARYMVLNATITHDEIPGLPGYSTAGDEAANNGNVAVSSVATTTARQHLEQWISGPFHAIGLLRPGLRTAGFGMYSDAGAGPWRAAATLDVLRGVDSSVRPAAPVVFPANGTTTHLSKLTSGESPDARALCGWSGDAGQPLLAMFPSAPGTATVSLTGPNGPVTACALGPSNTSGTAQQLLAGSNAVAVIPRSPLVAGAYQVEISTSSGGSVSWGFTVDPSVADGAVPVTPLPVTAPTAPAGGFAPMTPARSVDSRIGLAAQRLAPGAVVRLDIAGRVGVPATANAVSANVTIVAPAADGFLKMFPCGAVPEVSTVNFTSGRTIANAALLPLDATGDLCVVSTVAADLLIDINGSFSAAGSDRFVPAGPHRILDTRTGLGGASRQPSGGQITLRVRGVSGVPASATAVALTVTAVQPGSVASSYVTVWPCGARPETSNLNLVPGETRPNQVIVPLSASGDVCLYTTVPTDLLADLSGWFVAGTGRTFTPLAPLRMVDTRQGDGRVNAGTGGNRLGANTATRNVRVLLAGQRGIPTGVTAVSANLTVADPLGEGFVTAYACGTRPETSNLNFVGSIPTASAAQLVLDAEGAACFYVSEGTHLIVDVNGAWT